MRVESIGKPFYFATFVDDCSRFVHVYFLRSKDEVKSAFLEFKAYIENKLNCEIKTLQSDQGLAYVGPNYDHYLVKNGIKRERTCAYTPQINGIAERENRTLVSMARCLLIQSELPMKFWAEAINCAVYIRNRCPTRGLQDENQTPFQKLFSEKPTMKYFQTKPGRPRKQYNIKEEIEEAQIALEDDIPSLKEAFNGPNSEEWLEAMRTEYKALLKNQAGG
ncbi:Retrovirus-related Pol polyprotein from transposon TNT 1-94 [Araneus ventricosus]|uniref:Retrovirus-related Pol polyprotein from transposon TNT 1-94 n=1 Tax=Araneus ventricosus TaxID=182803 RepID=A0A4Y2S2B3_ARAVE|nr:Retrovirus-related Pol polyprotein from transposon TNT 1-94 [Araneus ventricosus]